jgi:hypothetical protein
MVVREITLLMGAGNFVLAQQRSAGQPTRTQLTQIDEQYNAWANYFSAQSTQWQMVCML